MGLMFGLTTGPTDGLIIGCVLSVAIWFQFGLCGTPRPALPGNSPVDPRAVWRQDGLFWLVAGLLVGLTFTLVIGITAGAGFALAFGAAASLMFGFTGGATWPAALTFLQLWLTGLGPLRMLRFLEDARARHVLRMVGPVYQFRHARLHDRLAEEFLRHSRGRSAGPARPSDASPYDLNLDLPRSPVARLIPSSFSCFEAYGTNIDARQ